MRFMVLVVFLVVTLQASAASGNEETVVSAIDLANIRDIGGHARGAINVSPDGRWVVFQLQSPELSEGAYELTWMAVSTGGGKALRIADGGDVLLNPTLRAWTNGNRPQVRAKWSPDSKRFVYLVRRNEQTQIWRSRPDRKGQIQLTHNTANVIDFAWSPDGSKLYFTTGLDRSQLEIRNEKEGARGFLYDSRFFPRISTQPVRRNCGDSYSYAGSISLERACEPAIWVYEFKSRKERLATSDEAKAFNQLHDSPFTPKAIEGRAFKQSHERASQNRYAWLENTDPEIYRGYAPLVAVYASIDDKIHPCLEEACLSYFGLGLRNFWWRQNGQEIVFLRREGSSYSQLGLYEWTPSTAGLRRVLQTDALLSDCAPAGDRLICLYESWTQPRKIVSVSLDDGSISTLYDPNPEFACRRFSRIEKLEWEDAFGNTTYGHLVYPIDYKPGHAYPLVIVTYQSRGFLRGGVGDEYPIHPLAAEGFFVLSHDMPIDMELAAKEPGSNPKLFRDLYRRKSVLSSQEFIIEQLAKAGLIDKTRIAITGLSEGAAQTTYALIHSDVVLTAAIASGAWDSPSSYYLMNEKARDWWQSLMDGPPDDPDSGTHRLSIGLNAGRVDTPLLINVSDQEFLGSVENVARLKDANKPVEMYVYPGEHHIKWQPDHRLAIYRRNIQWLKFWLLGEEEDDPVSLDQYARWREMRETQCEWLKGDDTPWYCDSGAK